MEQRREHARGDYDGPIQARCASWPDFLELYTRNIGQGGVFIRHDDPPELGVRVEVHIQMPNHQVLEIQGKVAHVVDSRSAAEKGIVPGFGVEFVDVSEEVVKAIADLLVIAHKHRDAPPPPIPRSK